MSSSSKGVDRTIKVRDGRAARQRLTCTNCRTRKTRCDGSQPGCKTCEVYKDTCVYDKLPSMAQIVHMAKQLQEAEQTIQRLKAQVGASPLNAASHNLDSEPSPELEPMLSDLSLDENGQLCYLGPTSAVHLPAVSPVPAALPPSNARDVLTTNALEMREWEGFALSSAAAQNEIPLPMMTKLLQIHWSWVAPMFMWVYRPAFIRDMTMGGPYFSQLLVTSLCAHSARFVDKHLVEILLARVRVLLSTSIHETSSIPTVQALLQLSAGSFATGRTSQAWLYSGMAFRMTTDLGLHHSTIGSSAFGMEDQEIRKRLFWSCYFWDKAISLYLGRAPALSRAPPPLDLFDESAEHEIWSPYGIVNLSNLPPGVYPPYKSHAATCFVNSTKLAVIINDIIETLYTRRQASDQPLIAIQERLQSWREDTPPHLSYDPSNLPEHCPPPHILTQNLLYYATIILLHRPFASRPAHHTTCSEAADSLETLSLLLERTFGFERVTYLMAYCIYTGASVVAQDARTSPKARQSLQTFLRALHGAVASCPIVQRSLDIIYGRTSDLRHEQPPPPSGLDSTLFNLPLQSTEPGYLPAFPFPDPQEDLFASLDTTASVQDVFSFLECFPETRVLDNGSDWWLSS